MIEIDTVLVLGVLGVALDSWRRVIRLEGIMKHCKYCRQEEKNGNHNH